jgi:DNA end-binding protein Ku
MRAIWKGHIRFSLVTIPIRIYSAVNSEQKISFNQLTKEGHHPIGYDKKDKVTGERVKNEDIVKGYQYEPGQYVIIEQEDIEKIKVKSTKVIEIEAFVDSSEVHPTLFEQPYFIGPDGDVAAKTYGLLLKTLEKSGKTGVGRVVLRDRENLVLLTPFEEGMVLYKLRNPDEVRSMTEVPKVGDIGKVDDEQLKMAQTLVDQMSKPFEKINTSDSYLEALREIIDAKIEGKEVVSYVAEEPEVVDIMTALKESISKAKADKKPMEKAGRKKREEAQGKKKKTG